jgi:hypothetical protein
MPLRLGRCHQTQHGVDVALDQVSYAPTVSRMSLARLPPTQVTVRSIALHEPTALDMLT